MLALLSLIPDWAKVAGGVGVGVLLAFGPSYFYGKHAATSELEASAAKNALTRIQEMEKNNAGFRNLPEHDRCVAFMRDSELPVASCDER